MEYIWTKGTNRGVSQAGVNALRDVILIRSIWLTSPGNKADSGTRGPTFIHEGNPSVIESERSKHMKNQVYKVIEITGTSTTGVEDAVNTALKRAGETIENLSWFEVVETRGSIDKNQVDHWQVTIKVGFSIK